MTVDNDNSNSNSITIRPDLRGSVGQRGAVGAAQPGPSGSAPLHPPARASSVGLRSCSHAVGPNDGPGRRTALAMAGRISLCRPPSSVLRLRAWPAVPAPTADYRHGRCSVLLLRRAAGPPAVGGGGNDFFFAHRGRAQGRGTRGISQQPCAISHRVVSAFVLRGVHTACLSCGRRGPAAPCGSPSAAGSPVRSDHATHGPWDPSSPPPTRSPGLRGR